jgi:hypothetical protein
MTIRTASTSHSYDSKKMGEGEEKNLIKAEEIGGGYEYGGEAHAHDTHDKLDDATAALAAGELLGLGSYTSHELSTGSMMPMFPTMIPHPSLNSPNLSGNSHKLLSSECV